MAIPREVLDEIKKGIDSAEEELKSLEEVVTDLRASGIDASLQAEAVDKIKVDLKRMRLFFNRQTKRGEGS